MGNPTITWDGNTLTLEDLDTYEYRRVFDREIVRSESGVSEVSVREAYDEVRLEMTSFDEESTRDEIVAWWSWAAGGNAYSFALDSDDTVNTTISTDANSGSSSLTVNDTTGIASGSRYLLREADGWTEEVVTVSTTPSGSTVTLSSNTNHTFSSGATLKSVDYFPSVESDDDQLPVVENPGLTWTFSHTFRERKSA